MFKGPKGEMVVWVLLTFLTIRALLPEGLLNVPYKNVEVLDVVREGEDYDLVASFEKTDCTFVRLEVFGSALGLWQFVPWEDNQGLGKNYDRSEGEQVLSIRIKPGGVAYDQLQVRTRHQCDKVIVDKVFTTVDLDTRGDYEDD